ncbi:unnamed protein product [Miscanthus lutarioriparius]|uniref:Uncharacterized protein n=1 Tax=Miscanthus lutarioriparius TaxID=422564 RepID=A0A811REU7_9POAL|nr:unnamed protein product [Miscanthus lutarioriparius]
MADLHPLDPSSSQHPDLQLRVQPRRGMKAAVLLPVAKVSPLPTAAVRLCSLGAIYAFVSALKEPGEFVVFRILWLRWAEQWCNGHLVARWLKSLAGLMKVEQQQQQQQHKEDADVG